MFDSVLVTVRTKDGRFSVDLDIPSTEPVGELKIKLLEILKLLNQQVFNGWQDIRIMNGSNNKLLLLAETLEEAEIWDGSILYVMQ